MLGYKNVIPLHCFQQRESTKENLIQQFSQPSPYISPNEEHSKSE